MAAFLAGAQKEVQSLLHGPSQLASALYERALSRDEESRKEQDVPPVMVVVADKARVGIGLASRAQRRVVEKIRDDITFVGLSKSESTSKMEGGYG